MKSLIEQGKLLSLSFSGAWGSPESPWSRGIAEIGKTEPLSHRRRSGDRENQTRSRGRLHPNKPRSGLLGTPGCAPRSSLKS